MVEPGKLLRNARRRHGVSQERLAIRARMSRSAISRIERNEVSPSVATLEELLYLVGETLIVQARRRKANIDIEALNERLRLTPGERIERGIEEANRIIEEAAAKRCRP